MKITIKEIKYSVAFISENRAINDNNVKKQKESLKVFGNLNPLTYVKGDNEGLKGKKIVDIDTDKEVSEENKGQYIVVVDGQHRVTAAKQLADNNEFDLNKLNWAEVEIPEGKTVTDVLIELNTVGQKWRGADYIAGYALRNPKDEIAMFAQSLAKEGVSSKTINKYIFFKERFSWAKIDEKALKEADIERANKIWDVVKTFPSNVKKSSIIIDCIIDRGGSYHWEEELTKVEAITEEKIKALENKKGRKLREEFEGLVA